MSTARNYSGVWRTPLRFWRLGSAFAPTYQQLAIGTAVMFLSWPLFDRLIGAGLGAIAAGLGLGIAVATTAGGTAPDGRKRPKWAWDRVRSWRPPTRNLATAGTSIAEIRNRCVKAGGRWWAVYRVDPRPWQTVDPTQRERMSHQLAQTWRDLDGREIQIYTFQQPRRLSRPLSERANALRANPKVAAQALPLGPEAQQLIAQWDSQAPSSEPATYLLVELEPAADRDFAAALRGLFDLESGTGASKKPPERDLAAVDLVLSHSVMKVKPLGAAESIAAATAWMSFTPPAVVPTGTTHAEDIDAWVKPGTVEEHPTYCVVDSDDGKRFVRALPVRALPNEVDLAESWSGLTGVHQDADVRLSLRTYVRTSRASTKMAGRRALNVRDQLREMVRAGRRPTEEEEGALAAAEHIQSMADGDAGEFRIADIDAVLVLTAKSLESLDALTQTVRQEAAQFTSSVAVVAPGAAWRIWSSTFWGAPRQTDWLSRVDVSFLAASHVDGAPIIGQGPAAPTFARTTQWAARAVGLDVTAIASQQTGTNAPVIASVGEMGTGKTVAAYAVAAQTLLAGARVVFIDPKSSSDLFAAHPAWARHAAVIDPTDLDPRVLDPLRHEWLEPRQRAMHAVEFLRLLLGERDDPAVQRDLTSLLAKVAGRPSLTMTELLQSSGEVNPALHSALTDAITAAGLDALLSDTPFEEHQQPPLIVLHTAALTQTAKGSIGNAETRAGDALFYGMILWTLSLLADKDTPGLLVIDEVFRVVDSEAGNKLIEEMARTSRSRWCALLMMSQSVSHFGGAGLQELISVRLGASVGNPTSAQAVASWLGLPAPVDQDTLDALAGRGPHPFHRGRFVLSMDGLTAQIFVDLPQDLLTWFGSTPEDAR